MGFADIFQSIFSGEKTSSTTSSYPVKGDDLRLDLTLDFKEAIFGNRKEIYVPHLETCTVCKFGSKTRICHSCTGTGLVKRSPRKLFGNVTDQVSVCPTCHGEGQVIEGKCESCAGQGRKQETKKLAITIPPGVYNGVRLRVSQEGDAGVRGGPPGDLYVYLFVEKDPEFSREDINILSTLSISYLQAILGCRLFVNTIDGQEELIIPPGTQSGTVLTLENKGVPKLGNSNLRGDHLITIQVEISINQEDTEKLLKKLSKIRDDSNE